VPAVYGLDWESGQMVMPLRERLGLQGHHPMSPALEDRLCYLAATSRSYEQAAESAKRFGAATDGSYGNSGVGRRKERCWHWNWLGGTGTGTKSGRRAHNWIEMRPISSCIWPESGIRVKSPAEAGGYFRLKPAEGHAPEGGGIYHGPASSAG